MKFNNATAVFDREVFPRDAEALSKKLGCPVEAISSGSLGRTAPTDALFYFSGAGSQFHDCADWAIKHAREHGYAHAGLDFNGRVATVAIDSARSDKECSAQLWQGYQDDLKAASDAYKLTAEYAESERARQEKNAAAAVAENKSFESAMLILGDPASSADTNPSFYKTLGAWILANDEIGSSKNPDHKPALLDALEAAGFANNEGVGNPAVKDKSDLRALGRYFVGQLLNMGRATSGICAGGAIHPMLGDRISTHGANPELSILHKIALRKAHNSAYEASSSTGPKPH
jgi:hypothetical protein